MAKQTILLYAPSGYGKTALLNTFVVGMYRQTQKLSRLCNADGGVDTISNLRDAGALYIWEMRNQLYPFEALNDATRGYWPKALDDPTSELVAPFFTRYVAECQACNKQLYNQDKACTTANITCTCKAEIPVRPRRAFNPANDLSQLGAYMFEGLTGFSDSLMENMSVRTAKGEKIGGEAGIRFKDNNYDVGGATQSHYGTAQRRIQSFVDNSRLLPVDYVLWTARKDRGTDDAKRTPVFGPKLAGHAATDDAPAWFGITLSLALWPIPGKEPERRVYLQNYTETYNPITKDVEHICNTRLPASVLQDVPPYYVFDRSKRGEFGAETLLWDIVQLIERKRTEAATVALKGTTAAPALQTKSQGAK